VGWGCSLQFLKIAGTICLFFDSENFPKNWNPWFSESGIFKEPELAVLL